MTKRIVAAALALCAAACTKTQTQRREAMPASSGARMVKIERVAQEHVGLKTAPAKMSQLTESLRVTGTVQPEDRRERRCRGRWRRW